MKNTVQTLFIKITGRVQGVWFRAETKEQADALDIKGWVKNNADGSVEVMAQGEEHALQKLIDWCRKGPPLARVENVETKERTEEKKYENFSLLYS